MSNVILLLTLYKEARKAPNSLLRIRGLCLAWGAVEKRPCIDGGEGIT